MILSTVMRQSYCVGLLGLGKGGTDPYLRRLRPYFFSRP